MLRVLHIIGKMDRAGAETMLMNLYRYIDRTQVQFDFITFTADQGDYDDEILALGGKIHPILANNSIERMFKLTKFLKQHSEYQIVHAHMLLNNAFHLLAAKRAGVKHRISHSHNTSNGKTGIISNLYEKLSIYLNINLSTAKIACGEEAAVYLFKSNKNVWILKNAIDLQLYNDISLNNKNYWSKIKNNIKGLKILQVGRLNEVKNHTFSLEVARKLKEKGVEFTFFLVGQGPLESLIKKKIQDYSLEENTLLLGVRDDVPNLMAGADVMLMPSLHEGFPVVLVESQAIGISTIVSENIAAEVDLGGGLIKFVPIDKKDSVDKWCDKICKINSIKHDGDRMLSSDFDVKNNASSLFNFYIQMK